MTRIPAKPSTLRLVTDERCDEATSSPPGNAGRARQWEAATRVAMENRAATALTADDARWALAARTAAELEGGPAAIMPPERRRVLVNLGEQLGLRRFDANLVIAIVQDAARSGERPLGPRARGLLRMVQPAPRRAETGPLWPQLLGALVAGACLLWLLVRWTLGA